MKLAVSEVIKATGGRLLTGDDKIIINGVSTDSRSTKRGDLFVAIKGERFDGHQFIDAAIKNGASAVLASSSVNASNVALILVSDTVCALKQLAAYYRQLFNTTVVGVTGSTGKTTTKEFIYAVLSQKYDVLKTQGNFNNQIGLPLTVFNLDEKHQYAVLEMGMSALGEIHDLAYIARPHIGVITNIGLSHMEKLGSRENILMAKKEIFDFFTSNDIAVLNSDDRMLRELGSMLPYQVRYFSINNIGDIRANNIYMYKNGCYAYELSMPDNQSLEIRLNIAGYHNIYNSLAAAAVGYEACVPVELIKRGIEGISSTPQRLRILEVSNVKLIDDTYNANPDSMKAAIDALCDVAKGRKIAVLGDMLELGHIAEQAHEEIGRFVAQKGIDVLVVIGDMAHLIAQGALNEGMFPDSIHEFKSNDDAEAWLDANLRDGDAMLVKGSHGMHMNEIVDYIVARKDSGRCIII